MECNGMYKRASVFVYSINKKRSSTDQPSSGVVANNAPQSNRWYHSKPSCKHP